MAGYNQLTPWRDRLAQLPKPCGLRLRAGIGLLAIDVPVAQILDGNLRAGRGANDIGAGFHDPEIAVEIFDFRRPGHRGAAIQPVHARFPFRFSLYPTSM